MARGVRLEVKGLNRIVKKFDHLAQYVVEEADPVFALHANEYVNLSVSSAPRDQGLLIQEISSYKEEGDLSYTVVSGAEWSAFIEWGTRSRVQIPADLVAYAAQFKSKSVSSQDAKKAIYEWCRRKGIPEEAWWSVFINIMTIGIYPHPFF
jgi:hypothetical protein